MSNLKVLATASIIAIPIAMNVTLSRPAQAAQFSFSYSGAGVQASGILMTSELDPATNTYTITGISGQRNGDQITGVIPKTVSGITLSDFYLPSGDGIVYNNILYKSSPHFDFIGLLFTVRSSSIPLRLFFDHGKYFDSIYRGGNDIEDIAVDFNLEKIETTESEAVAVPEPAEFLGTTVAGAILVGFGLLRRRLAVARTFQ